MKKFNFSSCATYFQFRSVIVDIRELKQQRRQGQRKRYLKINIWEMVTILLLLPLPHILIFDRARGKRTGRSAVEVDIENERFVFVCSRCR